MLFALALLLLLADPLEAWPGMTVSKSIRRAPATNSSPVSSVPRAGNRTTASPWVCPLPKYFGALLFYDGRLAETDSRETWLSHRRQVRARIRVEKDPGVLRQQL